MEDDEIPKLTYEDKILLHLLRYVGMEDHYVVVGDVTQEFISSMVCIQRKHLPRALKNLIVKDLIVERTAHVKGVKQKRKVYFLTNRGELIATRLREDIARLTVIFEDGHGSKCELSIGNVQEKVGIKYSVLELFMKMDEGKVIRASSLDTRPDPLTKKKKPELIRSEGHQKIYRTALEKAWIDGKITLNERVILDYLRSELGITLEEHEMMEAETLKKVPLIREERLDIYKMALKVAMRDLEIIEEEEDMLEALRAKLEISMMEHEELMKDILKEHEGVNL